MSKRKHTAETRKKIAKAMTGRACKEETKRKISATMQRKWTLIRQIEASSAA